MAIYHTAPAHERLNVFFGEFFRKMRKAPPQAYGRFLTRAEAEFKRLGYRDAVEGCVENILIVRLDAIGDMVLTSGFIREVRKNFPHAHITLIVNPHIRSIVEFCPYINEVITFVPFNDDFLEMLEKIAIFCRDNLWQKNFSIAFCPKSSGGKSQIPSLYLAWLSGARERIGYGVKLYKERPDKAPVQINDMDKFLITKNVVMPYNLFADPEKNFYLLIACGYKVTQTHMELFYTAADTRRAKEFLEILPSDCKKVVLGIGSNGASKKYPVEKLLVALKELLKKNLAFVIVGGKTELDDANFLEKNLPHGKILNLVGKTTLRETEAVIAQTDFYIGNDTGVMHMAATAKIPVLLLHKEAAEIDRLLSTEETLLKRFPPYQTKAIVLRPAHRLGECATLPPVYGGCYHNEPHCITQITPQEIVAGFERLQKL